LSALGIELPPIDSDLWGALPILLAPLVIPYVLYKIVTWGKKK